MTPDESLGFFVVPATAFRGIWDELRLVMEETKAKAVIYRYGRRTGEGYAHSLGLEADNYDEASNALSQLVAETGLGRINIEHPEGEIKAIFSETLESKVLKGSKASGCFFTSGALAGLISIVLGGRHESVEEKCLGKGDANCIFRIYPIEEEIGTSIESILDSLTDSLLAHLGLERGMIYLVKEGSEEINDILPTICSSGLSGMFITRDFPKKVREKYKFMGKVIWLSTSGDPDSIKAPDLAYLLYEIQSFLDQNEDPFIILSGIEYMVTNFGFLSLLKFLELVAEQVALKNALCFLTLNPDAFDKQQLGNIVRETVMYPSNT